jgi:hypothetical protein
MAGNKQGSLLPLALEEFVVRHDEKQTLAQFVTTRDVMIRAGHKRVRITL